MVGEVGQCLPYGDGRQASEQLGVAGWQPLGVLVEKLVGQRVQVGGSAARAGGVEHAEQPRCPWPQPVTQVSAALRRQYRVGRVHQRVGQLAPQVERLLRAARAGQRVADKVRPGAGGDAGAAYLDDVELDRQPPQPGHRGCLAALSRLGG